jgi:hypothetical protein
MRDEKNVHPSDQELLMRADGELSRRRAAQIDVHFAACWNCRARKAELEAGIADFVRVRREKLEPLVPPASVARARLVRQVAEMSKSSSAGAGARLRFPFGFGDWRFVAIGAVAMLVLVVAVAGLAKRNLSAVSSSYGRQLPDRRLTPGATRAVAMTEICAVSREDVVGEVPDAVRHQVFQEYGIANAKAEKYEVDYLIAPGLGGADDIRNLWPEPRFDAKWNSYVKDQLEEYLHESVCAGKVNLQTAQADESHDWISAYQKYFHTQEPLATYSTAGSERGVVGVDVRHVLLPGISSIVPGRKG